MKYRKKPVIVEAMQWKADRMQIVDVLRFFGGLKGTKAGSIGKKDGNLVIKTPEGERIANDGDWIIRGVQGELYPCKADIFEQTYEAVSEDMGVGGQWEASINNYERALNKYNEALAKVKDPEEAERITLDYSPPLNYMARKIADALIKRRKVENP